MRIIYPLRFIVFWLGVIPLVSLYFSFIVCCFVNFFFFRIRCNSYPKAKKMLIYFTFIYMQNGSVVMFGRVASYKFVDSPSDGRYNLVLSQSQLDSACLYER